MPWWAILLLCIACFGIGGFIVYVLVIHDLSKAFRRNF